MRRPYPPILWIFAVSAAPHVVFNFINIVLASATQYFDGLDNVILNDLIEAYATHEPSTCNTAASAAATSFSFDWPGANSQSNWFASHVSLEQGTFQAIMSHNDATGNRSWSIRIGTGGNIYSHFVPNMHGETIAPQGPESPWVDEVIQSVTVNYELDMNPKQPQYCPPGSDINNNTQCKKYFIHQAGAYQRDGAYTTVPFHSPSLARHCSGNSCIFASWGTSAHVATPFTSPIIYIHKYTNCNNGIIEHTQMIHNFANPNDPLSTALNVDQTFFDVAWGGVRSSSLPYALEPNQTTGTLNYANVNEVDYLPLCPWGGGNDEPGGPAGPAARQDLRNTGGYTTFVDGGLLVNQTFAPILPPCRKGSDPTCSNPATCMVMSCTDDQIRNNSYVRMELKVDAGRTPNCTYHMMWKGLVSLQCNLHDTGFGEISPYSELVDECYPWTDIGLANSRTGEVLTVATVHHWSFSVGNKKSYFAVYSTNETEAIDMVNAIFDNSGYAKSLPIDIVPMIQSFPRRGSTQTPPRRLPLVDVTASYDPGTLSAFTIVYGKGQDYGINLDGSSRRRIGSTSVGAGTRDFTVFTVNWLGARLQPGSTYVNRGFYFSSDLGSVNSVADELVPNTFADRIGLEQWSPRTLNAYKDGTKFIVLAALTAGGTSTECGSSSAKLICSGSSTPRSGYVPFFYVTCGSSSTYFGPNPYHFTPSFGSKFPGHGNIDNLVRSYACEGMDISFRPTWKLLGFFDPTNANCISFSTASYDATICGTERVPVTAIPVKSPTNSPTKTPTGYKQNRYRSKAYTNKTLSKTLKNRQKVDRTPAKAHRIQYKPYRNRSHINNYRIK